MHPKTAKYLEDIRSAAEFMQQVASGKSLADYRSDRGLRNIVERNFEIIGEAVNRIATADPDTAIRIAYYRRIVDFRNALIHGYDLVDDARVWDVLQDHLPELLATVTQLLQRNTTE